MKIIIDGDACPVKKEVITLAEAFNIQALIVSNYAHYTHAAYPKHVKVHYVDMGSDMADFKIFSLVEEEDLVITQDYGLASLVLDKCDVMHHKGYFYTPETMASQLTQRYISQQRRAAGERVQGPKAFSQADREHFNKALDNYLKKKQK